VLRTIFVFWFVFSFLCQAQTATWSGVLVDGQGTAIAGAVLDLESGSTKRNATTESDGRFRFESVPAGSYSLVLHLKGRSVLLGEQVNFPAAPEGAKLTLTDEGLLSLGSASAKSGGEELSERAVSSIPLNKRDFSQLLLMAAGTMTDSNGTTNFTQQFAVNGQRGVEAVFAMDGADISDPEMGGATMSNFNVDAVREIQSNSGWMPAEIGRGAAGFTNILTRSGAEGFHGSIFEFVRNSAFDARNFFDRRSFINPGRIPPFRRNEFGFTNGGPLIIPGLYDGRKKTFYFIEYQGFRQVLGTTQVLPVPTAEERAGIDTRAFPGDTLYVPVDPRVSKLIDRYPLPNDPTGSYGANTFATSSKVRTNANQFSARLDQNISEKSRFFARFTMDNLTGPTTNPDQTAIDPSFGIQYVDHQRNGVLTYSRTVSPSFNWESSVAVTRTTPSFPTPNKTDPALTFGDGLFVAFNSPAGSVTSSIGNLFQGRQTFSWTKGKHALKAGAEFRANRDTSYFGQNVNGSYTFGGGTAYSPVVIRSASGLHDIAVGAPLPDTLSALLTASPFAYTQAVAPQYFPQGNQIGVAAVSRYAADFFVQDTWKITGKLILEYGLRYELIWPFTERARRTAGMRTISTSNGLEQQYLINPEPPFKFDLNGFGPRVRLAWRATDKLQVTFAGAITTIPPNIWQDNLLTGAAPQVIYPRLTAAPNSPIVFGRRITSGELPQVYSLSGANIYASGDSKAVPPNTVWDVNRFERELAAITPGDQITPLNVNTMWNGFGNGTLDTWSLGLERHFGGLDVNAGYVGTAASRLPAIDFPNGYPGATPQFAPFTQFNSAGAVTGGFGTESLMTDRSHSTYHSLQTSVQGNIGHLGPIIQASYTWSKSLDDTSSVIGGFIYGASGATNLAWPQDPFNTRAEKGPSTFDVTHAFTANVVQDLHVDAIQLLAPLSRKITAGWQLLSVATINSGLPFTVYSGVQQTGAGSNGVDRPDQVATPTLSTSRTVREDYFGAGANNASYFYIPVEVPGGTGPNRGRFGTLGRDTFRGPALYNYDFALIKDTPLGSRSGGELMNAQFRAEFFNLFNIVNFGLPANIIKGSGFGEISRTASNSRQIQFSLKLIF
jgi:Carboxypeptidase regulatory-like domain